MNQPLDRPKHRGQALVLSALGMVLLVLMVCMTLSFGTKAKAKMEVQIVADQAAYSTAVAVARTYNVLALTNRVMMSHMTAMLGIQSAISFSAAYFSLVMQLFIYYPLEIINQLTVCIPVICPLCPLAGLVVADIILTRLTPVTLELGRLWANYAGLDIAAAKQAWRTGAAAMFLYLGETDAVMNRLYNAVHDQGITKRIVAKASAGIPAWKVENAGGNVARREAGFPANVPLAGLTGAINQSNLPFSDRHAVMAAMGARGHPFTSNRFSGAFPPNSVDNMLDQGFNRMNAKADITYVHMGNAYFGPSAHTNTMLSTTSRLAISDDHGLGKVSWTGPSATAPLTWPLIPVALVESNTAVGFHAGGFFVVLQVLLLLPNPVPIPVIVLFPIAPPPDFLHTVPAACVANCPSAWSNFVDYNLALVMDKNDNFAQPKLPVTVYKDAAASPPDPFNLMFDFRFSATGSGEKLDLAHGSQGVAGGGIVVRDGAGSADISRQMGYSTGISYYHRAGHWREPPNLFNPYWRAGITRADTDRKGFLDGRDIENTLDDSGVPWAHRAYTALIGVGYQGIAP